MKGFLILLVLGLVGSEKLDRTYLPPPGAKFSGGSPGAIQTPLELPKETYQTSGTLVTDNGLPTLGDPRIELGISRGQPEFGQVTTTKAPFTYYTENVPTTTTSYAFTQTTTLAPVENYGITVGPINPTTGLPVQYSSQNLSNLRFSSTPQNNFNVQGQRPSNPPVVFTNQPGIEGQVLNYGQPNYNQDNQLLGQYQDQYPITVIPEGNIQSGSVSQQTNQQGFQYPDGQNVSANIQPEYNNSIFGSNASPVSPINPQSTYNGQQNQGKKLQPGFNQPSYDQNPSQPLLENSKERLGPSSPEYFNQPIYSSTTPLPSIIPTMLPTFGSYVRPERPQAEADRNAVIINFENERTPNGYSYSYDTSNGIHADESGVIDNGTKAKGGYSYIGDDGKVYSVTYTADENGFQPRGDHLPTSPPIPEAIQKVIEQIARDNEAGISDDGSYDEEKYGDKKFQGKLNGYTSPNQDSNNFNNIYRSQNNRGKPISRLDNLSGEQNENARPNQFSNDFNAIENSRDLVKIPPRGPFNPVNKINQTDAPIAGTEDTTSLVTYGPDTEVSSIRPDQKGTKFEYPVLKESYIEPGKYSEYDSNKTPAAIAYNLQGGSNDGPKSPNGAVTSTGLNNVSGNPQTSVEDKQSENISQRPVANIRYTEMQNGIPEKYFVQKEAYNVFEDRRPGSQAGFNVEQSDANQPIPNQRTGVIKDRNDVNESGYTYNRPQTKFEQNRFPTRFREQESSMKPGEYRIEQGTTSKLFMTPYVYNREDGTQSSFARKPFEVILPTTESNNDYTDDDDYPTKDQGLGAERFSTTKVPVDITRTTVRPYQFKQSARPYQYTPVNQGTRVTQGVTPESKATESSLVPTTSMPSQSSRFGAPSTQKSEFQYKPRPTTVVSGSMRNIPSTEIPSRSGFISQNRPAIKYSTDSSPDTNKFGSRLPTSNRVTPQSYFTTTYKPVDYSSTIRPGFDLSSAPVAPETYQMGYQYGNSGPISSYGSNKATSRPVPIPSGPGMYSQLAPESTYQYGPVDYPQSTIRPLTGSPGSNFQTGNSQASPTATYQTGYQYGSVLPTTTGLVSPGFSASKSLTTPPTYSSSTNRPGFIEGYTQRPITVDNFGRPINSEDTYYPGYSSTQNTGSPSYVEGNRAQIPVSNQANVPGSVDSTGRPTYTGYETPERVIGEDFSGPKQPQRYDPKTGYHY